MKRGALCAALLMLALAGRAQAKTSFAIVPPKTGGGVSAEAGNTCVSRLTTSLLETGKYRVADRTQVEKILAEQAFQLSGAVDASKATEVGKLVGADKFVTVDLVPSGQNYDGTVKVLSIETGEWEFSASTGAGVPSDVCRWAVGLLAHKYPLLGSVLGTRGKDAYVDLGKQEKVQEGQRLFVSRVSVERADDGSVLFSSDERVGILRVQQVSAGRTKALLESGGPVMKGDRVSPEPIPLREVQLHTSPRLAGYEKGDLVFEDEMDATNLSPVSSQADAYEGGALVLDSRHLGGGHAYAFYGTALKPVNDFVYEVDVELAKDRNSRTNLYFRSDGEYAKGNCYTLFFNADGSFEIARFRLGTVNVFIPYRASPAFKQGLGETNEIRIVGVGGVFDIYANDQFVAGFEDEWYESGTFGFGANAGSYAEYDNVRVWSVKKK